MDSGLLLRALASQVKTPFVAAIVIANRYLMHIQDFSSLATLSRFLSRLIGVGRIDERETSPVVRVPAVPQHGLPHKGHTSKISGNVNVSS